MKCLTLEQIKSANDRKREFVPVPQWCPAGDDPAQYGVYVAQMTASQLPSPSRPANFFCSSSTFTPKLSRSVFANSKSGLPDRPTDLRRLSCNVSSSVRANMDASDQRAAALAARIREAAEAGDDLSDAAGEIAGSLTKWDVGLDAALAKRQEEMALFGLSGRDREKAQIKEKMAIAKQEGDDGKLAELEKMDAALSEREANAKESRRFFDDVAKMNADTPLMKLQKEAERIEEIFERGGISSDRKDYLLAQNELDRAELNRSPVDDGPERPAALERGSAAAFSAAFGQSPMSRQQAEMIRTQHRMATALEKIEKNVSVVAL